MALVIKEIGHISNPAPLARTIYKNFVYLADFPQLQHTQQEIEKFGIYPQFYGLVCL